MVVIKMLKAGMRELRSRPAVGGFWRLRSTVVTCMQQEGISLDAGTHSGYVRLTEHMSSIT